MEDNGDLWNESCVHVANDNWWWRPMWIESKVHVVVVRLCCGGCHLTITRTSPGSLPKMSMFNSNKNFNVFLPPKSTCLDNPTIVQTNKAVSWLLQTFHDMRRRFPTLWDIQTRVLDTTNLLLLNQSKKSVAIGIWQCFCLMSESHLDSADIQRRFRTHADVCRCRKTFSDTCRMSADIADIQRH